MEEILSMYSRRFTLVEKTMHHPLRRLRVSHGISSFCCPFCSIRPTCFYHVLCVEHNLQGSLDGCFPLKSRSDSPLNQILEWSASEENWIETSNEQLENNYSSFSSSPSSSCIQESNVFNQPMIWTKSPTKKINFLNLKFSHLIKFIWHLT